MSSGHWQYVIILRPTPQTVDQSGVPRWWCVDSTPNNIVHADPFGLTQTNQRVVFME
jgi:hypothetical protein